jgi:hypothetical protein
MGVMGATPPRWRRGPEQKEGRLGGRCLLARPEVLNPGLNHGLNPGLNPGLMNLA